MSASSNINVDHMANADVDAPLPAMGVAPVVAADHVQAGQHNAGPVVGHQADAQAHAPLGPQQQQQDQLQPNPTGRVLAPPLVVVAGLQHVAGGAPSLAIQVFSGPNAAADAASGTSQPIFSVSSHTDGITGYGGWAVDLEMDNAPKPENDDDDDDQEDFESGVDVDAANNNNDNNNLDNDEDDDPGAAAGVAVANDDDVIFIEEIITVE